MSSMPLIDESSIPKRIKKSLSSQDFMMDDINNDVISIRADVKHNFVKSCVIPSYHAQSSPQQKLKVETCKRFMCLTSKLVAHKCVSSREKKKDARGQFHRLLTNMFNTDKQIGQDTPEAVDQKSEQYMWRSQAQECWQSEFKDLIWLELQAWFADRSLTHQDKFLCEARKTIRSTLEEFMGYRFNPPAKFHHSSEEFQDIDHLHSDSLDITSTCEKCLYIFCGNCIELQNLALKEVVQLFERLEKAESLYPSSKALAAHYPLYASEAFIAKLKTLNIWLNRTKQMRFRLLIVARTFEADVKDLNKKERGFKSTLSTEEDKDQVNVHDSANTIRQQSFDSGFDSPEASVGLTLNLGSLNFPDFYDIKPIAHLGKHFPPNQMDMSPTYKTFVQRTLKKQGLVQSLMFLEKLHRWLVRQQKTFQAPEENSKLQSPELTEDHELAKFGYWGKEFRELNLPSSRGVYLFLARIPLDIMYSFFRLRLETNPEKPSPMSLLQLMTELKKGIRLAVLNKQRYLRHVAVALKGEPNAVKENFHKPVYTFDDIMQQVLELYLKYLQEWVKIVQQESIKKYILEEEWVFVKQVSPHIPEGRARCGVSFCQMAASMLRGLIIRLKGYNSDCEKTATMHFTREDLDEKLRLYEDHQMLIYSVLDTRDNVMKTLALGKVLRKDLECCEEMNLPMCGDSTMAKSLDELKNEVLEVCLTMKHIILQIQMFSDHSFPTEFEFVVYKNRKRDVQSAIYRFGFECHREAARLMTGEARDTLARYIVDFVESWVNFVQEYYERGRGLRPRWAMCGLDFLVLASEPINTQHLSEAQFERFKEKVNNCIQHIIGTQEDRNGHTKASSILHKNSAEINRHMFYSTSLCSSYDANQNCSTSDCHCTYQFQEDYHFMRKIKISKAVEDLEEKLENKRREENLIGTVVEIQGAIPYNFTAKKHSINFSWQRGFKIGQGRFGKVYTAVNNETGELVAMKEIQLQKQNDPRFINDMMVELRILEGITHKHLVKYYGVEIHQEEILLFMELCTEGTLENLIASTENGLPEVLVRKYSKQLVDAVNLLHQKTIVHRDIKSANIFLTAEGNSLKLGDFGSAVKISAHTTVPGELNGFVGTQAYMAPEVFMNTNTTGHGRASDIWSLGCVLVEMASGKRPWSEYDSNYQIMFKVGMGETPTIPESLSDEGHAFVDLCLQHDPSHRVTVFELSQHPFLIVSCEEDVSNTRIFPPTVLSDYMNQGLLHPQLSDLGVKTASASSDDVME